MRSLEQVEGDVMLFAREVIRELHFSMGAEQVASRVWVMRTRDLEAWKKELEF